MDCTGAALDALASRGWALWPGYLEPAAAAALRAEAEALRADGRFRHAGVGRGTNFQVRPGIRGDRLVWLDATCAAPAAHAHVARMHALREAFNESLFLGLRDFEAHLSVYPPGARYRAHLDHFRNTAHRVVSSVLYLNHTPWDPADGGCLRLYTGGQPRGEHVDVVPAGGTLVLFLSQRFWHEVLPATRERWSLTGWFTRRP